MKVREDFDLNKLITDYDMGFNDETGKYIAYSGYMSYGLEIKSWNREVNFILNSKKNTTATQILYNLIKDGVIELEEDETDTEPEPETGPETTPEENENQE